MSELTCGCNPEAGWICASHTWLAKHPSTILLPATHNDPDRIGPTRATTLPDDAKSRKEYPVASGVLDYFPDALVAVAHVSYVGNEQHNPGQPLHWARGKSMDESDTLIRHFLQRGTRDTDGQRHSAKLAWRALAILQKEIEADDAFQGLQGRAEIVREREGQ